MRRHDLINKKIKTFGDQPQKAIQETEHWPGYGCRKILFLGFCWAQGGRVALVSSMGSEQTWRRRGRAWLRGRSSCLSLDPEGRETSSTSKGSQLLKKGPGQRTLMACWDISIEAFKQLHFWLTILLIIKAICGRLGQQNIDLSSFDINKVVTTSNKDWPELSSPIAIGEKTASRGPRYASSNCSGTWNLMNHAVACVCEW